MGRTLTDGTHTNRRNNVWSDGTTLGQTGRGLGMARHYHTSGATTKASPRVGGSPPPQAGLGKTQTKGSPPGETIVLPKSIEWLEKTPRDR